MDVGRTQLNIRMSADEKEEWTEYTEESRWSDSLTDFVKEAVREKIERMDSPSAPSGSAEQEASGEVIDRIQDLQNDLQDLQGDVSQAVNAVHAQQGIDPEIPPEIHSALPLGEENAATVSELVEDGSYAFSEAEAGFALENMARNMGNVKRTSEPPVGWYKVE